MIIYSSPGDCRDELEEKECGKIVKKDQCAKKGEMCMKSCDMCKDGGGEMTTTQTGGTIEANLPLLLYVISQKRPFIGECRDELDEKDCTKIVKKDQCKKKGQMCMKSCNMCNDGSGGEDTTPVGGIVKV